MEKEQVKRLKKFGIEWVKVIHSKYRVKKYILGIKIVDEYRFENISRLLEDKIDNIDIRLNYIHNHISEVQKNIYDLYPYLNDLDDKIRLNISRALSIFDLHRKTFAGYKNKFQGQTVVLLGCGPTLNQYEPIEGAIHVGLNRAILFDKVQLDYLFAIDKAGVDKIYQELIDYKGNNCKKFIGDQNLGLNWQIPESVILKMEAARYKTDAPYPTKFAFDIETEPLGNAGTVSLQAMQFILYTNPSKVYIVGIDCSTAGHFTDNTEKHIATTDISQRGDDMEEWKDISIRQWTKFKEFANIYYPETEIISINPVGLKGLFKDIYTVKEEDINKCI